MKTIKTEELNTIKIDIKTTPLSFDIETSKTVINEQKIAFMYIWQFGIGDYVVFGRTWREFNELLDELAKILRPSEKNTIVIFIHNLGYEFQFMRKWLGHGLKVLAADNRTPIRVLDQSRNIEFRCSLLLSGLSLEKTAENLTKHKVKKLVGNLDYETIRNSKTTLTNEEIAYCEADVEIVNAYVSEMIDEYKDVHKIPLTSTGIVRRHLRNKCLYKDGKPNNNYSRLIRNLTIEKEEYIILKNAFAGGFTKSNPYHTDIINYNLQHWDEGSAYPYQMVVEKFPMSKGRRIKVNSEKEYRELKKTNILIGAVAFKNLRSKTKNVAYLSKAKAIRPESIRGRMNIKSENGRVYKADIYMANLTSIDMEIINNFYDWDEVRFGTTYIYKAAYLPKELVEGILELYKAKTELKGVEGKEAEYNLSKSKINGVYGMTVQDPCKDENSYVEDQMVSIEVNIEKQLNEYNKSHTRILFYPWGVCVTAYARRALLFMIKKCGSDFVYSDTDSIFNLGDHTEDFKKYNEFVNKKTEYVSEIRGIDISLFRPKTKKGKEKPMGIFEQEPSITCFKTLGAKRYIMEEIIGDETKFTITIAGLSKKSGKEYIENNGKFDFFNDGMKIPEEYSGRLISSYEDFENGEELEMDITDYQGNVAKIHEKSYIYLEASEYNMSMADEYLDFIDGLRPAKLASLVAM